MAENEQIDLPQKQEMWHNFIRLGQWVAGLSAVVLILLAIFVV